MAENEHPVHRAGDAAPVGAAESGDGVVTLADGSLRWGRFGAAGVLVRHTDAEGEAWYFVARRAPQTHHGGTWALPGGALNRSESPLEGALREFAEEMGEPLGRFQLVSEHEDDHGGWSYWTLLLDVARRFAEPVALNWETVEVRWVRAAELAALDLLGAFRTTLGHLGIL